MQLKTAGGELGPFNINLVKEKMMMNDDDKEMYSKFVLLQCVFLVECTSTIL